MESIDRLRRYVTGGAGQGISIICEKNILKDLDAIEREVKANRVDAYTEGYDVGFASADDWAAQHEDAMAEHGWVPMPEDADGVPIHVGERVQLIGNDPSTVSHMSLAGDGWRVYVKYDGDLGTGSGEPSRIRHHHAPTVEDVLRKFAERLDEIGSEDDCVGVDEQECRACIRRDIAAAYVEYAAKLQLKED